MERPPPGSPRPLSARHQAELAWLRHWSDLLDNAFRIPGTDARLGWDPIVGLIPGVGDAVTATLGAFVVVQAFRMRIPRVVQLRMLVNILVDTVLGFVPVVGDVFDVAWKANAMNFRLLEHHAFEIHPPSVGDWLFVTVTVAVVALSIILPLVAAAWLFSALGRSLI